MKRLLLLLLFIFPAVPYLYAQTFEAGFYAGATVSDIPGTDNIDNDVDFEKLGFTVAGTVSTKISPKTRLQMEIRFFQRGAQQSPTIVNDSASSAVVNPSGQYYTPYFTLRLNYVDVVVGIKHAIHFNIRNKATDRYGIEAGVSLGTLVGYYYEVNSINYNLDLNLIDISPYIGLYYNVTPHFYIEGRYSNSINSVLKHDGTDGSDFYYLYYNSWNNGHNVAFDFVLGFNLFGGSGQSGDNPGGGTQSDN